MNRKFLGAALLVGIACNGFAASPRERLRFDSDWKFTIDNRELIELEDVYPRRNDDTNLTYLVETSTNLLSRTWETTGTIPIGTNAMGGGIHHEQITNRLPIGETAAYIRLTVVSE